MSSGSGHGRARRGGSGTARRLRRPSSVTPARWAAWLVLRRTFEEDAWTDRAFTAVVEQLELDGRERAFAQRLAYGTVQSAKRLDHVIAVLGKRPLAKLDPPVLHALRIGMYELLELQEATGPDGERLGSSSAHAAVSQAVELVRGVVGERAVAFTNAILRRAQVDGARILGELDLDDDEQLATALSMPAWLVRRARASHGERGIDALRAHDRGHDGTALRINRAHPDQHQARERIEALGVELRDASTLDVPGSIVVTGSTAPLAPLIADGLLAPQSLASQLVALALDPQPGDRVLDMCAAPGGKTTHIASLLEGRGEVVAVELHEHRAESIRAFASRTGTREVVRVRVGDATELDPAEVGRFDRILLDAPCTGTGVLAARPDARWKRSEDALAGLVDLQTRLLATAATLLRPGGTIVYSTCSILADEDERIADAAPASLAPLALPAALAPLVDPDDPSRARTWPQQHGTDGFFIARFQRSDTEADRPT